MFARWPAIVSSDRESMDAVFWWLVRLRSVAVLGVALVLALAGPVLGAIPSGSAPWLWLTAAGLLAYNGLLAFLGPRRGWPWLTGFTGQIAIDCLVLAALVHFGGGADNPFLPLFVLHVVNANIVLSRRAAGGVLVLACGLAAAMVLAEGTGVLEHHCLRPAGVPCGSSALDVRTLGALGGLVLTLVAASVFTRFLTERLRAGQRQLSDTVVELTVEKQRLADTHAAIDMERARLQAIIDCMGDAVIFMDAEGRSLFSNRRARELWPPDDPTEGAAPFEALLPELARAGTECPVERGGRLFETTRSPVLNAQGQTLGVVTVIRDVTDRLAIERYLMREEQLSVVGRLAATVAHEINNPIAVVSLYSQHALSKLPADSPVYEHLQTIRRSAERCRATVGGLLKLARQPHPERRQVDLHEICREVVDQVGPMAVQAGVRVSGGPGPDDYPLWVQADPDMLHQAVLNLAVNAIEACGEGTDVTVGACEVGRGPCPCRSIEVRDTGPGIAAEDVGRIFQPFFTTKTTGTGLGLAVADNIARSHGGRIDVESSPETGTIFRIVLSDCPPLQTSSFVPEEVRV